MKKIYKNLSSILVIFVVFFVMIGSIIVKDKEISKLENKKLQVIPIVENIINEDYSINSYIYENLTGDIFRKWDNYFSDHIIYRDNIVNSYTSIQEVLGREFFNSAYIGEDNYIFTDNYVGLSDNYLNDTANYYNLLPEKLNMDKLYLIRLPHKNEIYEDKMPIDEYTTMISGDFEILKKHLNREEIEVIDIYDNLKGVDNLYHKTDHHWNMNGSFLAYKNIIDEISKDYPQVGESNIKDNYDIEIYEEYFVGTDGKRIGSLIKELDNIEIYRDKNESRYEVNIGDKEGEFFYEENLVKGELNNDYAVYLGGDNPEVIIENTESQNDLEVVILGDSMDNSLISLLSSHFNKIYSYDLRHYEGNIEERIKEIKPDIFIIIGLTNNILTGKKEVFKVE